MPYENQPKPMYEKEKDIKPWQTKDTIAQKKSKSH